MRFSQLRSECHLLVMSASFGIESRENLDKHVQIYSFQSNSTVQRRRTDRGGIPRAFAMLKRRNFVQRRGKNSSAWDKWDLRTPTRSRCSTRDARIRSGSFLLFCYREPSRRNFYICPLVPPEMRKRGTEHFDFSVALLFVVGFGDRRERSDELNGSPRESSSSSRFRRSSRMGRN